ncbi:MAG: HlyD family efflux transporter periplasmic adaptor subunit [Sphingobacteriaceae bacterium]|nr:MAG: HlyD family efflux transporter periplasmic adaptor subunit [Sphingobacteriaceae bacterium]
MRKAVYFILLVFVFSSCSDKQEQTKPIISDITVSLYASAVVKAEGQYSVYSTVPGVIKKVMVRPGDIVKKGAVLFVLDNSEARLNAETSRQILDFNESNYQANSNKLQEAVYKVQMAKEKYQLDSSFFYRQKNLWDQNIGTKAELDQRSLNYSTSKINYESAIKALAQLKAQLKNETEVARLNYRISQKRQTDFTVKSEIDGQVFDVIKKAGELINPQTILAVVGKPDQYYLEMEVDENDITQVKLNQPVTITMDSYKGKVFEGKVSKIYPIMDERSRTFKVEAVFTDPPKLLYPNLTAEVNIIVQVKRNVILIPRDYLDDKNNVWLADDKKVNVTTGVQDYHHIEVLKGLDTSQVIYKPVK